LKKRYDVFAKGDKHGVIFAIFFNREPKLQLLQT